MAVCFYFIFYMSTRICLLCVVEGSSPSTDGLFTPGLPRPEGCIMIVEHSEVNGQGYMVKLTFSLPFWPYLELNLVPSPKKLIAFVSMNAI